MSISFEDVKKVVEDIRESSDDGELHNIFPNWFVVKILGYGEDILDRCFIGKTKDLKLILG